MAAVSRYQRVAHQLAILAAISLDWAKVNGDSRPAIYSLDRPELILEEPALHPIDRSPSLQVENDVRDIGLLRRLQVVDRSRQKPAPGHRAWPAGRCPAACRRWRLDAHSSARALAALGEQLGESRVGSSTVGTSQGWGGSWIVPNSEKNQYKRAQIP